MSPGVVPLEVANVTIVLVHQDYLRLNGLVCEAECGNDHTMTDGDPMGCRAVAAALARPSLAFENVRFESVPVIHIPHMNQLAWEQTNAGYVVSIDRYAADVIDVCPSDGSAVDLAF